MSSFFNSSLNLSNALVKDEKTITLCPLFIAWLMRLIQVSIFIEEALKLSTNIFGSIHSCLNLVRLANTSIFVALSFNDILLDRDTLKLIKGEKSIVLGKKEFQILEMLILNAGKSIDKEKFIEKIWGYDTDAEYNTIEVYVSFLRKKLNAVDSKTEIKSLRGIGYTIGAQND